jgi:hypothetical protein
LSNVTVTDDRGVTITGPAGDANSDGKLDPGRDLDVHGQRHGGGRPVQQLGYGDGHRRPEPAGERQRPSHYFGYTPTGIRIEKSTNGEDADSAPGPLLAVGSPVTWTYVVTNTGQYPAVERDGDDDQGVTIAGPAGDANNDGNSTRVRPGRTRPAARRWPDSTANTGTATATDVLNQPVSASDLSHYFGYTPTGIRIEKSTNGEDADNAPGPLVAVGSPVTWTYVVTNTGNTPLSNVTVTDDQGVTIAGPAGDANNDGKLDPGETWTYTANGTAEAGQYSNLGTATAIDALGQPVSDSDLSHYFGYTPTGIRIEKSTNGEDADARPVRCWRWARRWRGPTW